MNVGDYTRGNGGGRKPDFVVKVGLRGERYHKRVGAAWKTKSGGIAVKLEPGIALVSGTDVVVTLWPNEERPQQANQQQDTPPWGE